MLKLKYPRCSYNISRIPVNHCPICHLSLSPLLLTFLMDIELMKADLCVSNKYKLAFLRSFLFLLQSNHKISIWEVLKDLRNFSYSLYHYDEDFSSLITDNPEKDIHTIWNLFQSDTYKEFLYKGYIVVVNMRLGDEIRFLNGMPSFSKDELEKFIISIEATLCKEEELNTTRELADNISTNISDNQNKHVYDMYLEELDLSVRAYNALKYHGINTFSDLQDLIESQQLHSLRNIGRKTTCEILAKYSQVKVIAHNGDFYRVLDTTKNDASIFYGRLSPENAQTSIDDIFHEDVFQNFRQCCKHNNIRKLEDLIGIPYKALFETPAIRPEQTQMILQRWTEIVDYNGAFYAKESEPFSIHEQCAALPLEVLSYCVLPLRIFHRLEKKGFSHLRDFQGLTLKTLSVQIDYSYLNELPRSLRIFSLPYKQALVKLMERFSENNAFEYLLYRDSNHTLRDLAQMFDVSTQYISQSTIILEHKIHTLIQPMLNELKRYTQKIDEGQIFEYLGNEQYAQVIINTLRRRTNIFS